MTLEDSSVVVVDVVAKVVVDAGSLVGLVATDLCLFIMARLIPNLGISGMMMSLPLPPIGIMLSGMVSFALYLATTLSPRLMTNLPKRPPG